MRRIVNNLLYKELSYKVHGAAIEVRKDFGPGHKEQLYQKAFGDELKRRNLSFEKELAIKIYSPKDGKFVGAYRPDFIIDGKILVEIKAKKFVTHAEILRVYDYLRNSKYELAYLINFASERLFVRRIIFTNDRKPFLSGKPLKNTNCKPTSAKLLVAISFILVSISGIAGAQTAAPSLMVSPPIFELSASRGQTIEDKIKILNQSEVAMPMQVRAIDFTAEDETGRAIYDESSADSSFASRFWFEFPKPNFILDAGQSQDVEFKIAIPENAEPGGHYASVLFEPQLPSYYFEEGKPRVIPVVGIPVLIGVNVENIVRPIEPLTIVEFGIPENLHLKSLEDILSGIVGLFPEAQAAQARPFSIVATSHLPFTLRIQNNDLFHVKPEGKLEIYSGFNQKAGETEIQKMTILPDKIRKFPVDFKPVLPRFLERILPDRISNLISRNFLIGKYRAHLSLSVTVYAGILNSESAVPELRTDRFEQDFEFWVFPWKVILIFAFVLALLILMRHRIAAALKVLVRPSFKPFKPPPA